MLYNAMLYNMAGTVVEEPVIWVAFKTMRGTKKEQVSKRLQEGSKLPRQSLLII